jgi:hypothetical protein
MMMIIPILRRGAKSTTAAKAAATVTSAHSLQLQLPALTSTSPLSLPSTSTSPFSTQVQEDNNSNTGNIELSKASKQKIASNYNNRRSNYKKAVSKLRKQYATEYAKQTKQDLESKQKQQQVVTRQRLERQRLKNIKSVKNAMKQEELRIAQKKIFEEHLKTQAVKDEKRKIRFEKARRLVLKELEQQAVYWLTTKEDVDMQLDQKFNPFIEQQLWTRPGSFIGEPAPSNDSQYWKYESHTWKVQATYPTKNEKLLENIEDMVYDRTNVDYNIYWNEERVNYQNELEEKAKLRALVLNEGKKALLHKQRQMMQDVHTQQQVVNKEEMIVPPILDLPVPSTDILANYDAMEYEGVKALKDDPTKFFVFAHDNNADEDGSSASTSTSAADANANVNTDTNDETSSDSTSNLGKPIRLVDPVRDSTFTNTPYPELIGKLPKPDTRTEREKKKAEREERMLAAANLAAAGGSEDDNDEVDADAENAFTFGGGHAEEITDYEKIANFADEDDLEWEKGLDPIMDKDLLDTPWDERYTDEDIEWIISKLESKVESLKEIVALEEGSKVIKALGGDQDAGDGESSEDDADDQDQDDDSTPKTQEEYDDAVLDAMGPGTVKSTKVDDKGREYVTYDVVDDVDDLEFDDADDLMAALGANDLNDLIRMQDEQNVLKTLSDEQIVALQSIGDDDNANGTTDFEKTAEEIKEALSKVPGLTDVQVQSLVDLEMSLASNEKVQKKLKGKKKN